MVESLLGYGPQGLALEVNPWVTRESIHSMHLYRGAIIGGWANVETSLIELSIRASHHAAYVGHRELYPKRLSSRIAYLNDIFNLPGPLLRFSRFGQAVVRRFLALEDIRNIMAHAHVKILPDWGATFYLFQPKSGSEISYRWQRFSQEELRRHAIRATRFSRAVRYMIARIDAEQLLPPLE